MSDPMVDGALQAAHYGAVLPISNVDRAPWVPFDEAERTPAGIRALWRAYPGAGVGVLAHTGSLLVLDVESPTKKPDCPNGFATMTALQRELGQLPLTRTHRTKSGGVHQVFRVPDGARLRSAQGRIRGIGREAPGVDVVTGRAVLRWPPTFGYRLEGWVSEPADLPQCWLEALVDTERPPTPPKVFEGPGRLERYCERALELECEELAGLQAGRNCALTRAAYNLGTLVHVLGELRVRAALIQASERNGSLREDRRKTMDTLERCMRRGSQNPRDLSAL